jgi:hypothetical protein
VTTFLSGIPRAFIVNADGSGFADSTNARRETIVVPTDYPLDDIYIPTDHYIKKSQNTEGRRPLRGGTSATRKQPISQGTATRARSSSSIDSGIETSVRDIALKNGYGRKCASVWESKGRRTEIEPNRRKRTGPSRVPAGKVIKYRDFFNMVMSGMAGSALNFRSGHPPPCIFSGKSAELRRNRAQRKFAASVPERAKWLTKIGSRLNELF